MHELSVATELYQGLRSEVEARGGTRIVSARIRVGELSAIEPELLRFAWEALVAAGPDAGAQLEIEWCAVIATCPDCGVVEPAPSRGWLRLCPHCSAPVRLEDGRELDVLSLAFDEDEEQQPGDRQSPLNPIQRPVGADRR